MKMDRKLVSSKQPWEPSFVAKKFKVRVSVVRKIMATLNTVSRKRIEDGMKVYKAFADNKSFS